MGEVYRATDMALDRPVALKLLPRAIASDADARARFYREARAQARINHPNVCHIYYIGEEEGQIFFAMELVEGESLQQRLERAGKLPMGEAVEYCRQAALGLREAWKHGFTHRDIKPSNLMIDGRGTVKLVDFGLVQRTAGGDPAITGGTTLVGTPLYVSPEQARGDKTDFRADIYSLGVTLHHLVSGAPPFSGETPLAVVSKHLAEPRPRVLPRGKGTSAVLEQLLDRMMAKRPDDRFADYDELLAALEKLSPRVSREAGFWVRLFASGLDFMFVLLLTLPLRFLPKAVTAIEPIVWMGPLWVIVFLAWRGQTPGKRALEVEVVRSDGAARLGWRRAIVRFLAQYGPTLALLGVSWLLRHSASAPLDKLRDAVAAATGVLALFVPVVIAAVCMWMRRRMPWDVMAGTSVLYKRLPG